MNMEFWDEIYQHEIFAPWKKIENDILNRKRHFCNGEQYIMLYTGSFLNIMYASVPHKNY